MNFIQINSHLVFLIILGKTADRRVVNSITYAIKSIIMNWMNISTDA